MIAMAADRRGFWKTYFRTSYGDMPVANESEFDEYIQRKDKKGLWHFQIFPVIPIIFVVSYTIVLSGLERNESAGYDFLLNTINPETLMLEPWVFYFDDIREKLFEIGYPHRTRVMLHLATITTVAYSYFIVHALLYYRIFRFSLYRRLIEEARYGATRWRRKFWAIIPGTGICVGVLFLKTFGEGENLRHLSYAHQSTHLFVVDALMIGVILWFLIGPIIFEISVIRIFLKYRRYQYHIPVRARLDRVRARMNSQGTTHG